MNNIAKGMNIDLEHAQNEDVPFYEPVSLHQIDSKDPYANISQEQLK